MVNYKLEQCHEMKMGGLKPPKNRENVPYCKRDSQGGDNFPVQYALKMTQSSFVGVWISK